MFVTVEKAIEELKEGRAIIVVDDEGRENEGDFVVLAEFATPDYDQFHGYGRPGLNLCPD